MAGIITRAPIPDQAPYLHFQEFWWQWILIFLQDPRIQEMFGMLSDEDHCSVYAGIVARLCELEVEGRCGSRSIPIRKPIGSNPFKMLTTQEFVEAVCATSSNSCNHFQGGFF